MVRSFGSGLGIWQQPEMPNLLLHYTNISTCHLWKHEDMADLEHLHE